MRLLPKSLKLITIFPRSPKPLGVPLFIVAPINFGVLCLVHVLLFSNFVLLDGKERADCFTSIDFLVSCDRYVLWHFITVPLVGLQCVIVIFPDHTHLYCVCLCREIQLLKL